MNCRSCKNDQLKLVIDLGIQAWCNNFLQKSEIGKEQTYPLRMFRCEKCGLCQLDTTVPKEIMFKEHTYVSGTTQSLKDHFYKVAKENIEQFDLKDGDVIYDIGGNDGTQLIQYRKLGINSVINIESATNIAKLSSKNGIPTMNEFFNEDFVRADSLGEIKLINAAGVFFHLEELHSVIRGIKLSLQEDGVFVVQFMYLGDMLEKLSFDGIYHEH
ncbi:MAG: methyltransferase, partial [Promethearchaeota archaeon]